MTPEEAEAKKELEAARVQVVESEQVLQKIKSRLRQLGPPSTPTGEEPPNTLEIVALKVDGLPEKAEPNFVLQLSSPIEEKKLSRIFDPLNADAEGSVAKFTGVETSVATITIDAMDDKIPLGSSESHDVGSLTKMDPMEGNKSCTVEVPIKFYAKSELETVGEESKTSTEPICTVTFRISFKPSVQDVREELYTLLNEATQKKSKAIDQMRKSAAAVSRSTPPTSPSFRASPAMKAGFLNKKKKQQKSRLVELYERTLGPQSLIRQLFPVAKNYFIFAGVVWLCHYRGQYLALPAPV
uniref:Uncharacterized protein n=1 Tax=Grammatophora oceanica TaxID=210454 RepID=A0A7S1Y2D0_9STRA|mmetsp:Transcript_17877/g.26487  ORF Transcript_17877/g.26487 Transcript_17877/m.26487 type:complete len:298 (+) Transcript_17877:124-1017(+)|eukprot:CAMPEP_0194031970 /NCGR_PEP_ID=MMETSP0009_2-20130614/5020_1 /TAXON_ID=210454 /ORGANISM="Grammatophora oceanica, Strain CCMP 410" /LENGTH=297 /DNA_ID=CAMNT_0038672269 /DNA_START=116 /DNA_END=1009 /DNA_ORIENTATION=+